MNDLLLPHFVVTLHHRGGLCQSPDVDSGLLGLLPFLLLFAALGLVLALSRGHCETVALVSSISECVLPAIQHQILSRYGVVSPFPRCVCPLCFMLHATLHCCEEYGDIKKSRSHR